MPVCPTCLKFSLLISTRVERGLLPFHSFIARCHSTLVQFPTPVSCRTSSRTTSADDQCSESIFDTPEHGIASPEKAPEPSDWEYDSHDSFNSKLERYPGENLSDAPAYENHTIDNPVDMGEAIEFAFPHNPEYDVSGDEDMFDDGLDGEESECSDASSNYEELVEPDVMLTFVKARASEVPPAESQDGLDESMESEYSSDEAYEPSSDEEDLNETDSGKKLNAAANVAMNIVMVQHTATSQLTTQPPVTAISSVSQSSPSTILSQVLTTDLELKEQEKKRDASQWKLLELQEALRNMELHIVDAEAAFQEAEAAVISRNTTKLTKIVGSGLSVELFEAYQDFRESLQPEFGMRDGFSITCYHAHKGSYIDYDPEFLIFKDSVELDYNSCNFRCEPGKEPISRYHPKELVDVVHFWPLRCPEPRTGLETTWGEQYVSRVGSSSIPTSSNQNSRNFMGLHFKQ